MRFRVNLHVEGAPRLLLERHQSGVAWLALHDSAAAHDADAQYVAIFAPFLPAETLKRAVDAFNGEISAALAGVERRTPPAAAA